MAGIDVVVHLAAFFRGATEAQARAANYDGTLALARLGLDADVAQFIYVSTNLVYGPGRGRPAREDDKLQPACGTFYNVADDEPVSAADILQLAGEAVTDEAKQSILDDPWEGIVDTARIKIELGFHPIYRLMQAAQEAGVL
jgi:nucleoside-diphosphate-sugar epimerase